MKSFPKYIAIISFTIVAFISVSVFKEIYNQNKFNNTKLNVSMSDFKKEWGNPDYEAINFDEINPKDQSRVLKYECWDGYYIFLTNSTGKLITQKFIDD